MVFESQTKLISLIPQGQRGTSIFLTLNPGAVFIPGMAEHGIRQTGTELLRLFYGFPVDSFDSVEYLFSAASPA
jgi:hypothetical protein